MSTKTRKNLTAKERKLTAIQRNALEAIKNATGPIPLLLSPTITRESLLARKFIDRIGPARARQPNYVLTALGRSVLAYHELHTGRAKR